MPSPKPHWTATWPIRWRRSNGSPIPGRAWPAPRPGAPEVTLEGAFFESLFGYDPVADITQYHGPLFVAVGLEDEAVLPQPTSAQLLIDYQPGADSRLFVRPMDHAFDALEGLARVDELIAVMRRFLARHLSH